MGKVLLIGFIAVLVVGVLLALAAVGSYNNIVGLSQATDSQWAQVQNVYQRRADLIPNLVNTVAGAANFEKSTLAEVVNARASVGKVQLPANAPTDPQKLAEFEQAQGQLTSALSRLLVVVERYPDLKSNQSFLALQTQLEGSENRISVERGRFNDAVRDYNTAIQRFPGMLVAGFGGFHPKPYFQGAPGVEKAPQVQFNFGPNAAPAPAPAR